MIGLFLDTMIWVGPYSPFSTILSAIRPPFPFHREYIFVYILIFCMCKSKAVMLCAVLFFKHSVVRRLVEWTSPPPPKVPICESVCKSSRKLTPHVSLHSHVFSTPKCAFFSTRKTHTTVCRMLNNQ
jgi:hypothetical protein